jgi:hypothetical protein
LTRFETTETTKTNTSVSKQTEKNKKSNIKLDYPQKKKKKFRFEPKQSETHLFRLIFGLFRETKQKFSVPFVLMFRIRIETTERTETNRSVSKQIEKTNKTREGGGDLVPEALDQKLKFEV